MTVDDIIDGTGAPQLDTTCLSLGEALSAFVDGEATLDEKILLIPHLRACRPCRVRLASYQELDRMIRNVATARSGQEFLRT